MNPREHSTAETKIMAVCTITDPDERQRRLNQVYGLLLDLARTKRSGRRGATVLPNAQT